MSESTVNGTTEEIEKTEEQSDKTEEQPNDLQASVLEILKAKLPSLPTEGEVVLVPLQDVVLSNDVQVREREDQQWVDQFAVKYALGVKITPPNAFAGFNTVEGVEHLVIYIGDGHHRVYGKIKAEREASAIRDTKQRPGLMNVLLKYSGTGEQAKAAAELDNAERNIGHNALPLRGDGDKSRAAFTLRHAGWTEEQIADKLTVSVQTVQNWLMAQRIMRDAGVRLPIGVAAELMTVQRHVSADDENVHPSVLELAKKAKELKWTRPDTKVHTAGVVYEFKPAEGTNPPTKTERPKDAAGFAAAQESLQRYLHPETFEPTVDHPAEGDESPDTTKSNETTAAGQGIAGNMAAPPEPPEQHMIEAIHSFFDLCASKVSIDDDGKPNVDWRYTPEQIRQSVIDHFGRIERRDFETRLALVNEYSGKIIAALHPGQPTPIA